ncbi:MAG TPA: T9SS type A sorting domain-containing protein [Bacteroidota bacterium]|nr:T9SS type A sorting domain-containing protein [Bacteroidota bacterium]
MRTLRFHPIFRRGSVTFILFAISVLFSSVAPAQPRYRTFSQAEFALKKLKDVGKVEFVRARFIFHNDSSYTVNSLHAKFNGHIIAIEDSGGFTLFAPAEKKGFNASGRTVAGHDSVAIVILLNKDKVKASAEKWWWDTSGTRIGPVYKDLAAASAEGLSREPNGGNVRDFMYKHEIRRPNGLLVGMPTSTPNVGWIRYLTADRKYFPHTDSSRCFDFIQRDNGGTRPFVGELKNPHVRKHNNHLLGEIHTLKIAVVANDSGVTAPFDSGATHLGDLIYLDAGNLTDPCNNMTIRRIIEVTDSALTFCSRFTGSFYFGQDSCISRINRAFDGPIVAASFNPLRVNGTQTLPPYLHPNPNAVPVRPPTAGFSILDDTPGEFAIRQNYPNPFNPSTTIEFNLPEASIVTLKVYNVLGQEVATLLNREEMDEGAQSVEFNAANMPSGVYFYRLVAFTPADHRQLYQAVRRMMIVR